MIKGSEQKSLEDCVETALKQASLRGATQAEVAASSSEGLSVSVRDQEVETLQFKKHHGFSITVYKGKAKGASTTSDLSIAAIERAVSAALDIAHYTVEDECAGLAESDLMANCLPDLDLFHPWALDSAEAIELALSCESAGLAVSDHIRKSNGASVNAFQGVSVYGNSHGFLAGVDGTRHSIGCGMIAESGGEMERSHWYSGSRNPASLESPMAVGEVAANRALKRMGGRKLKTCEVPVLYAAEIASSLVGHLLTAVSGGALYRSSSFLLNKLDSVVASPIVSIWERPLLKQGHASAAFDGDGLATYEKQIVTDGVLDSYIMGSYSARRLGLASTANAGGVRNVRASNTGHSFDELLATMDKGLLVTQLMGQGVNLVTGDYSRAAEGFWVEDGEIQFPVKEVTVAGNLSQMLNRIVAIGTDVDSRGNVQVGSILIDKMRVGGA